MTNKKTFNNPQFGFTLVETLVAVLLLVTAVAGPLTLASKSLLAAVVAKDQITAFFLAQDAVEYVRFIRDTNKLRDGNWLTGAGANPAGIDLTPCLGNNGCYLDSTGNSVSGSSGPNILACSQNDCLSTSGNTVGTGALPLRYNTSTNRFTYVTTGSTVTVFVRSVKVVESVDEREAKIIVAVYWNDPGGKKRSVVVEENIFKWQ